VTGGTSFLSGELSLETSAFSLDVFDDRGVEGIDHILYVNYYAEACGVNGGGVYLFYDGEQLAEAMDISSVADGGVFWFSEDLIFPDDEKGEEGYIIYEREHGESMDENMLWDRTVSNRVYLKWENGQFTPDISELDFGDH
jgi:hypothetical protein